MQSAASTARFPAAPGMRARPPVRRQFGRLQQAMGVVFSAMIFFMIAFPKGGLKIQELPITIGYVLVIPTALIGLYLSTRSRPNWSTIYVLASALALAGWSLLCIRAFGGQQTGFRIAYLVSITVLPIWAALCFSDAVMVRWAPALRGALVWAIRFVAIYGIFLFVFKYVTGTWVEIPYLTVNVGDIGGLDDKHINRGGIFKLISTYNNGNIFGVCMAIMAPLYLLLEKRKVFIAVLAVAMLLTLSRTVWIAILLVAVFHFISRGVKLVYVAYMGVGLIVFAIGLIGVMYLAELDMAFLTDTKLGGRLVSFNYLTDAGFVPFRAGIDLPEIVYIGILYNYGMIGLALFLNMLLSPAIAFLAHGRKFFELSMGAACMQGQVVYTIIAASDAAFNYIPVMMEFWMIAFLGLWAMHSEPKRKVLRLR